VASKVQNFGVSFTPGFSPVSGAAKSQETVLTVFLLLQLTRPADIQHLHFSHRRVNR
jgi:hypothetical protein